MTGFWSKAWPWLKKWGWAVLAVLGALAGAGWLWSARQRLLGNARDAELVAAARQRITDLQTMRNDIEARVGATDHLIASIDEQILDNKRQLVELHEGGDKVKDEDLERAFRELGY